jgi:23S rRNA (pseudouridine1915-N3)-methyltransferase
MQLQVLAIGRRMPPWVGDGVTEYASRLPAERGWRVVELPLGQRARGVAADRAVTDEGERMLARSPADAFVVALDERGDAWNSRDLARHLGRWRDENRTVVLMVGGPDGLAPACKERANDVWSLSALTLPHGLVRVVVAEQVYRAWSLLNNHPYHRD